MKSSARLQPLDDEYYMRLALEEAQVAFEAGEVPIGAVVVCQGQVIARAHNQVEQLRDPTAHAEMLAITAATEALSASRLSGCSLYVTIEPCPMCAGGIRWARLSEVIYGAAEEKFGYTIYSSEILPSSCRRRTGVLEQEARALMQEFFRLRR
ncbi:nucleoside deaminase [Porphyromonas sp. COT-239 OH1446]|uniref:nucleoside deaminase n=1 Tax=Porphyromonas sp. COT-239 OH1446 TaxID=1515613 RepID=UPI00052D5F20|nr:nucleoside deaminase [Porphyromonas sp. COT-239 OH1446]KGN67156.1 CMP deaminase [Porphyromonas sp. COT-239 OH1446]